MTRIYNCPHCKSRFRGVNGLWIDRHRLLCWPEDSPLWGEGDREYILASPWIDREMVE